MSLKRQERNQRKFRKMIGIINNQKRIAKRAEARAERMEGQK